MKNTEQNKQLTISEMDGLLVELFDTKYWPAIYSCLEGWRITNENTFKILDPFKQPTELARTQGRDEALRYLPNYIKTKIKKIEEKEKGKQKK